MFDASWRDSEKLRAAMIALARFHAATVDFATPLTRSVSPGIKQRLEILDQSIQALPALDSALRRSSRPEEFNKVASDILRGFRAGYGSIRVDLSLSKSVETHLQPVIRDVHADHILYRGNQVSGIIDFGAMNTDTTAVDISRLLGSLAGDDAQARHTALAAYQQVVPLDARQLDLIRTFDRSTVLLSGMNWLRWILLEDRQFDDFARVLTRLHVTTGRLPHLIKE